MTPHDAAVAHYCGQHGFTKYGFMTPLTALLEADGACHTRNCKCKLLTDEDLKVIAAEAGVPEDEDLLLEDFECGMCFDYRRYVGFIPDGWKLREHPELGPGICFLEVSNTNRLDGKMRKYSDFFWYWDSFAHPVFWVVEVDAHTCKELRDLWCVELALLAR